MGIIKIATFLRQLLKGNGLYCILRSILRSRPVGRFLFVLGDMVAGTGRRVYAPKGRGGAGCE